MIITTNKKNTPSGYQQHFGTTMKAFGKAKGSVPIIKCIIQLMNNSLYAKYTGNQ